MKQTHYFHSNYQNGPVVCELIRGFMQHRMELPFDAVKNLKECRSH